MAKKRKGLGMNAFRFPIEVVRTPEQHRAIIQPSRPPKEPKAVRPPRSRAKRVRLANAGTGTSSLSARMLAMGLRLYSDYLLTPHWRDVRERWKASNMFKGWVCHSFGCDSKEGLSLHHWTYERVGREELSDLILVCRDCHKRIHSLERRGTPLKEATQKVTKNLPVAA